MTFKQPNNEWKQYVMAFIVLMGLLVMIVSTGCTINLVNIPRATAPGCAPDKPPPLTASDHTLDEMLDTE